MVYFENEDELYIAWIENHPDGHIVNAGTSGKGKSIIHTGRCAHIYPPDPERDNTGPYPKACSTRRAELERWARKMDHQLTVCPNCDI